MSQPQPEHHTQTQCGMMIGNGMIAYRCTRPLGHAARGEDPEPHYAVEVTSSVEVWRQWHARQQALIAEDSSADSPEPRIGDTVDCPDCGNPTLALMGNPETGTITEARCGTEGCDLIAPVVSSPGGGAVPVPATAKVDEEPAPPASTFVHDTIWDDKAIAAERSLERPADIEIVTGGFYTISLAPLLGQHYSVPAVAEVLVISLPSDDEGHTKVRFQVADIPFLFEIPHDTFLRCMRDPDPKPQPEQPEIGDLTADQMDAMLRGEKPEGTPDIPGLTSPLTGIAKIGGPTRTREGDQRLPDGDESVEDDQSLIIKDIEERRQVGIQRYGQGHRPFNGRDTLQDLYEEQLDLLVYLRSLKRMAQADRETLVEAMEKALYPEFVRTRHYQDEDVQGHQDARRAAEAAVDRIMGWVVGQRIGDQEGAEAWE